MPRSTTALLALLVPCDAVRRLDLTATSGEVSGKYAFDGGEPEATCKACIAVMEHVQRRVDAPMYDQFYGKERKGKMGVDSMKLNKAHRISEVLDPNACREAMQSYDLAFVGGENRFQYKDPKFGESMPYPVHMELNDWAKNELAMFCESLIEEYEEDLTTLLSDEEEDKAGLPEKVCKHKLALCVPPPPPPPPKKEKKKSRKARLKEARKVFDSFDSSKDGYVTRAEMREALEARKKDEDGPEKLDKDLEEFFRLDRNGDNYISFSEYKHMWVEPKVDKSKGGGSASEILSWRDWIPDPDQAFESARTFTAESPYAVLSGIGITTAAVYVGGMVARFW